MKGRMEHRIRTENNINKILKGLPKCVSDYYYNISVSHEPKTCEEYIRKISKFLHFYSNDIKNIDVTNITDTDVAKYLHSLETKCNKNNSAKMTTFSYRKMVYSSLNSFFGYLHKTNKIGSNIVKSIDRPRNEDEVTRKRLTTKDFNSILSSVESGVGSKRSINKQKKWRNRDYAIFIVLMCTGMRETALTEINLDDIDFDNNTMKVIDKRFTVHTYHINEKMRAAIERWLVDRKKFLGSSNCDALFISNQKKRISECSVSNIVKKYAQTALGYSISPHKIRSAFCTILYDQTGDIEFVRDAVGHKNIETTRRYIVKDGSTKEKSSNIINSLI